MKRKTPPYPELADRLYLAKKRYELKTGEDLEQKEVARRVGLTPGLVSSWFTGKRMPSVEQLDKLSRLLDAHPGWLAFGKRGTFTTPDGVVLTEAEPDGGQDGHRDQAKPGRK